MRIVCPFCDSAYEVPRSLLRDEGQMVRCARCNQEWAPEPAPTASAPPAPVPLAPASIAGRPAAASPQGADGETEPQLGQRASSTGPAVLNGDETDPIGALLKQQRATGLGERLTGRQKHTETMAPFLAPIDSGSLRVSLLSRRMRLLSVLAWVASLAVLAAAVLTIYVRRPEIQAVWPASERLYRFLGLS